MWKQNCKDKPNLVSYEEEVRKERNKLNNGCYNCRWCNMKDHEFPCIDCEGGNWEARKERQLPSREKIILFCLMFAIVVLVWFMSAQQIKVEELQEQSVISEQMSKSVQGEYTLFQYTDAGWINPIYIEEYHLDGQVLYYKEKGNKQELPISFVTLRIVPGWVVGDDLMQYGFWIPDELGF